MLFVIYIAHILARLGESNYGHWLSTFDLFDWCGKFLRSIRLFWFAPLVADIVNFRWNRCTYKFRHHNFFRILFFGKFIYLFFFFADTKTTFFWFFYWCAQWKHVNVVFSLACVVQNFWSRFYGAFNAMRLKKRDVSRIFLCVLNVGTCLGAFAIVLVCSSHSCTQTTYARTHRCAHSARPYSCSSHSLARALSGQAIAGNQCTHTHARGCEFRYICCCCCCSVVHKRRSYTIYAVAANRESEQKYNMIFICSKNVESKQLN